VLQGAAVSPSRPPTRVDEEDVALHQRLLPPRAPQPELPVVLLVLLAQPIPGGGVSVRLLLLLLLLGVCHGPCTMISPLAPPLYFANRLLLFDGKDELLLLCVSTECVWID